MSPKPEPLNTSGPAVEREHHPISHSSIQSLPIPAATSNNRFGASLPALQDPRCVPLIFLFIHSHFRDAVASFRAIESCWCSSRDLSSNLVMFIFFSLTEADEYLQILNHE